MGMIIYSGSGTLVWVGEIVTEARLEGPRGGASHEEAAAASLNGRDSQSGVFGKRGGIGYGAV
jgi:hypothetical protein